MKNSAYIVVLLLVSTASLSGLQGCMAVPVALGANLVHKSGTASAVLVGNEDAKGAFKVAAISAGGIVVISGSEYSKAEFSQVDVKVEMQKIDGKRYRILGSSNSNVGRSYELKDNIGGITQRVADSLLQSGYTIESFERSRGL